ncbi:ATP synthase F0 subunit B [Mycoplasmopsis agassizii]|uniref:ATP synthase subunit b n=1 Tax=Mycoplasmopsis agassizii TaxID=33922 RepID=A0A269TJX8_9BACT|nr:F0F1 ATP synthase subunit B [Mycoplasmopsis agassizii]PAK21248.1 ATP synthase F0 subunit B [Mycoplasmopsis agassizii]
MDLLQTISTRSDTGQEIRATFERLFPSVPLLIATLIAFILSFLLITYLIYKPVKKFVAERQKYIQENIDSVEVNKRESEHLLTSAHDSLSEARVQAQNIISKAKIEAEKISYVEIDRAKQEAKQIIEDAHLDEKRQKEKFEENAQKQILDISLALSKKVIAKEISKDVEAQLINEIDKSLAELKENN